MNASKTITELLDGQKLVIFDVGARGGFQKRWNLIGDNAFFVGFEPDHDEYKRLSEQSTDNILYINSALDSSPQEKTLNLCRERGCSSIYKPNHDFVKDFSYGWAFEIDETLTLTTTTMDMACEAHSIWPDVLKLDTQGAELDILLGGEKALEDVLLIETEVSFQELYVGAPLFSDIDKHIRSKGFRLLGLRRSYWRTTPSLGRSEGGHIVHGDALYYRDTFDQLNKTQAVKLMAALLCYRQYDLVAHLSRLFNTPEIAELIPTAPFWTKPFGRIIRGRLHRILRKAADKIRYHAKDWHDPDYY